MSKQVRPILAAAALFAAGLVYAADKVAVVRLSEPVEVAAGFETFGAPLDESVQAVELGQILADADDYLGIPLRVEASVSQVCRKKGCFFIARDGNSVVRVSFKDYGFFVPTDISGKRVTLVGEVVARELTSEQADHLAADLGDPEAPIESGKVYEIVAASVRIPRG